MSFNRKITVVFGIAILLQFSLLQDNQVSAQIDFNSYKISLLTYSPGDKLYSIFGHSALRVKGDGSDLVYNYGTFDFNDPDFYFKFIEGKLMYHLSRVPFEYVLRMIESENRSLIETPLQLSLKEKTKTVQYLQINYLPENREYRYNFLYNNCSSKIIDVINFGTSNLTAYNPMVIPRKSFRLLLDPYLSTRHWTHMGIDFLMGIPADKISEGTEASFLPDYLHLLVKNAKIGEVQGANRELAFPDIIHHHQVESKTRPSLKPEWILWPLVLICIVSLIFDTHFQVFFTWFNKILMFGFGSMGFLLLLLWVSTSHYIFNFNTDILWANPLLLFVPFMKTESRGILSKRVKYLFLLFVFLSASAGSLTSIFLEKNLNLTALSLLILTALFDRIKSIQRNPEKQLAFD